MTSGDSGFNTIIGTKVMLDDSFKSIEESSINFRVLYIKAVGQRPL